MRSLPRKFLMAAWSAILAFLILGFGQNIWGALLFANLRFSPTIPWLILAMSLAMHAMAKATFAAADERGSAAIGRLTGLAYTLQNAELRSRVVEGQLRVRRRMVAHVRPG